FTSINFCIVGSGWCDARSPGIDSWSGDLDLQIFPFDPRRQRDRDIRGERVRIRTRSAGGVHVAKTEVHVHRKAVFDHRFSDHSQWRVTILQGIAGSKQLPDGLQAFTFCLAPCRRLLSLTYLEEPGVFPIEEVIDG